MLRGNTITSAQQLCQVSYMTLQIKWSLSLLTSLSVDPDWIYHLGMRTQSCYCCHLAGLQTHVYLLSLSPSVGSQPPSIKFWMQSIV